MSSPAKKKAKRAFKKPKISFKECVLACKVLSLLYGFEDEDDKIQWDYEKNANVLPENVAKASHKKFWFWCPKCKHSFQKHTHHITNLKQGCGFCSGHTRCQSKECAHCYATSFANAAKIKPQHAKHLTTFIDQWSDQNDLEPWMVSASNGEKFKFGCQACGHTIEQHLFSLMNGHGCGYCDGKKFCGDSDCAHCKDRSVAGNPMPQAQWDTEANRKNGHEAHTTARCCDKKFDWICPNPNDDGSFHTFEMRAGDVAAGHGCNCLKNKTEKKVYDFLQTQFGTTLIGAQFVSKISYDWCRSSETNTKLRYDIIIRLADGTLIIIEVDGPHHYDPESYHARKSKHDIPKRDRFKERRAVDNGHSLIRLNQEDVWNEKTDWQTMLLDAISLCRTSEENIVVKTY